MFKTVLLWIKRGLLVFWLLAMFVLGMLVFNENRELIPVDFILFDFKAVPTGVILCALLLTGGVLGYVTSYVQFKSREFVLTRRFNKTKRSLSQLKADQLKMEQANTEQQKG